LDLNRWLGNFTAITLLRPDRPPRPRRRRDRAENRGARAPVVCAAAQTPLRPDPGPLTIARQGSFFIGGREVKSDTLSTLPAYAARPVSPTEKREA
jgi:hypothetical protein